MPRVTLTEAYQATSKDPVVEFWTRIRIAYCSGGACILPCCSGRHRELKRWLSCKSHGIAACLGSRR